MKMCVAWFCSWYRARIKYNSGNTTPQLLRFPPRLFSKINGTPIRGKIGGGQGNLPERASIFLAVRYTTEQSGSTHAVWFSAIVDVKEVSPPLSLSLKMEGTDGSSVRRYQTRYWGMQVRWFVPLEQSSAKAVAIIVQNPYQGFSRFLGLDCTPAANQ